MNKNNDLYALADLEKENLKRVNRQRNSALMVDFATNLLNMLARRKGARYSVSTNYAGAANTKLSEAQERLLSAQRDYNARRAMLAFKDLLKGNFENTEQGAMPKAAPMSYVPKKSSLLSKPVQLQPGLYKPQKPQLVDLSEYKKKIKYNKLK